VNHGGKIFRILKFRTMEVEQTPTGEVWASPDDPRITRIGAVLRRYRLDELPQLFNVLTGEMNLVGPRPEQPRIFAELREKIDHYPVRQRVLPGITGWAQVNRAYDQTFDDVKEKVDFDIEYLNRRSALEDIRIMMRTVPVVLLKRGSM
jgi:lipopolysaccharide/colanic/teichoic acid biosynthesis glycosyltransferase